MENLNEEEKMIVEDIDLDKLEKTKINEDIPVDVSQDVDIDPEVLYRAKNIETENVLKEKTELEETFLDKVDKMIRKLKNIIGIK